uniref:Uncharacterized protein n=1 Tax=Oryza brachyantha TaxID=4533 RepID=J3MKM9_ORYBR
MNMGGMRIWPGYGREHLSTRQGPLTVLHCELFSQQTAQFLCKTVWFSLILNLYLSRFPRYPLSCLCWRSVPTPPAVRSARPTGPTPSPSSCSTCSGTSPSSPSRPRCSPRRSTRHPPCRSASGSPGTCSSASSTSSASPSSTGVAGRCAAAALGWIRGLRVMGISGSGEGLLGLAPNSIIDPSRCVIKSI